MKSICFGVALAVSVVSTHALSGATLPYTESFDSQAGTTPVDNQGQPWAESDDAAWSLGGGAYQINKAGGTAAAYITPASPLDERTFEMTTEFTVQAASVTSNYSTTRVGFGAYGTSGLTASGSDYYLMDFVAAKGPLEATPLGLLRILELGDDESTVYTSAQALAFVPDRAYRMTATGAPNGAMGITLTLTVTDLTTLQSIDLTADYNTTLTGSAFGYRHGVATEGTLQASFDNFGLTVPEPGAMGLIGLGCFLAFTRTDHP